MKVIGDGVEQVVASEARRFVSKDPTKLKLVAGLYALSGVNLELGKVARASYFFIRHLDDLLDGEMAGVADLLGYTEDLRDQVTSRQFKDTPRIGRLAAYALPVLERRGQPSDNPGADFVQVIDAMVFDYHRRLERRTLTEDELATYYNDTLDPGTNLMLMGFRSDLRAGDIPAFSPNLGRLYSIRDFKKDWEHGFINIPGEVLAANNLISSQDFVEVAGHAGIQEWFGDEIADASAWLQAVRQDIPSHERLTRIVLNGFIDQAVQVQRPVLA